MKFKYNINHQISLLPRDIAISDIVKVLEREGISQDSFYRDRAIKSGSDQSIPADRLFIYADVFECDVYDLFPRKRRIPGIRSRRPSKSGVVKKIGLK